MNGELRKKLISMMDAELKAKEALSEGRYEGYPEALETLHIQHAEEFLRIVDEFGWPGKSVVETDGATAAFMLARNAISTPDLQMQFFKHIQKAVAAGEATAKHEACLQDCILFYQGNPQKYGLMFDWDERGELVANVENIAEANKRRKSLGLKTLAEDLLLHKNEIQQEGGGPPRDISENKRQELAWAKRVGWRSV